MSRLPPSSPISHKIVVGTIATIAGMYMFWQTGKDFEWVKFEPRLKEEVEQRKRDNVRMTMRELDERTLDYTPDAKERLGRAIEERNRKFLDSTSDKTRDSSKDQK